MSGNSTGRVDNTFDQRDSRNQMNLFASQQPVYPQTGVSTAANTQSFQVQQ